MSYVNRIRPRDPRSIFGSKLKLWFDVRDWQVASRMTVSSDLISSWTDRASGLTVTGTTTQRPTLVTLASGRKAVRFDGTATRLRGTTTTGLPSGTTAFVMLAIGSTAANTTRFALSFGDATNFGQLGFANSSGNARVFGRATTSKTITGNVNIPLNETLSFGAYIDSTLRLRQFGKIGSNASSDSAINTGTGTLCVGANSAASPGNFFQGDIEQLLVVENPTLAQLIEWELWAAQYASLTNQLDGYADVAVTALGNSAVLVPATYATSVGLGPSSRIQSTTSPLYPGIPTPIDPTRLNVATISLYTDTVATLSNTKKETGVIFCDAFGTQVGSEFVAFTDDGDWPQDTKSVRKIIIAPYGTTSEVADVTAPSGATHYKAFPRDVGSSGFTLSADWLASTLPLNTAPKPFDGLGFAGVWGLCTLVTGYQGPLVTVLRSDGVTRTWWAKADGTFPVAEFIEWQGALSHVITAVYEQRSGRRNALDTTRVSYIAFDGPVPAFGGKSPELDLTDSCRGILRNVSGATMTALRLTEDPRQSSNDTDVAVWSQGDGAGSQRLGLHLKKGVSGPLPDGVNGTPSVVASRLDSDTPAIGASTGFAELTCTYRLHTVDWDGATGNARTWLDDPADGGEKATETGLTSTGNTDTTLSTRVLVGNFLGTIVAFGIRASTWSDAEQTLLATRLKDVADMTLMSSAVQSIYATTRNWVNRPLIVERAGIITHGGSDNTARRHITQYPTGRRTMISEVPALLRKYSDHVAPCNLLTSDGRLFVPFSSHGVEPAIRCRLSTDGTVANLGAETTLSFAPGGTGLAEYVSAWQHGTSIALATQEGDSNWGWLVWLDDTEVTPTFEPFQRFLSHSTTVYVQGAMVDADTLRFFAYSRPTQAENHVRVLDIDLSTGLHSADGVDLGYWDGSAASGNTLPVTHDTLPIAIRVPAYKAIRPTDVSKNGAVIVGVLFDSPANDSTIGQIVAYVRTGSDPYDEASYTALPGLPSAGQTFDAENVRFCDVYVSRKTHTGLDLFICRREGTTRTDTIYFLEKWRSPSGLGGDWEVTLLKRSPYILSRPISPEGATTDRVFVLETTTYNNLTYDISRDLIIG